MTLTKEQLSILDHTKNRSANQHYCGDSPDMDVLIDLELMEFIGSKPHVPSGYYAITRKGLEVLND